MSLGMGVLLAVVILAIVVGFIIRRKEQGARLSTGYGLSSPDPLPKTAQAVPEEKDPSLVEFRRRMESSAGQGNDLEVVFQKSFGDLAGDLTFEEALGEAAKMGYKVEDLALLMDKRGLSLQAIARFVDAQKEPDLLYLMRFLMPFAKGETTFEKAQSVVSAAEDVWELDDEVKVLVGALYDLNCEPMDVARIVYEATSKRLGEIIPLLGLCEKLPQAIGDIAKKLEVDLSDYDEYSSMRDGGVEFDQAARILRDCGRSCEEILNAENSYDLLALDDVREIIDAFASAGFDLQDVLGGIWSSDFTDGESPANIVIALYDNEIPPEQIAELLQREEVDIDELEGEFLEQGMDLRTRVRILSAFLDELDKVKEPTPAPTPTTV